jgi:hypothetical protein
MNIAVITGDVHHYTKMIKTSLKSELSKYELPALKQYLSIINHYDTKVTIFVTGKLVKKHIDFFKKIRKQNYVEVGGHGYSLDGELVYRSYYFLTKQAANINIKIPYVFRKKYYELDLIRMLNAFNTIGVRTVTLYRPHSYIDDEALYSVLPKYGVRVLVTENPKQNTGEPMITKKGALMIIYQSLKDDQIIDFFPNKQLLTHYKLYLLENINKLINSQSNMILQLHPICMKILDNYDTFKLILNKLHEYNYKFLFLSEYVRHYLYDE